MKQYQKSLIWFRRDLRLEDHRALYEACEKSLVVVPLFIFDKKILENLQDKDDARVTFIFQTIKNLQLSLSKINKKILIEYGDPAEIIPKVLLEFGIEAIFVNEDYEPMAIKRDEKIANYAKKMKIDFNVFKDHVVTAPHEIKNLQGKPYQVFTPYKKSWLKYLDDNENLLKRYSPKLKNLIDQSEIKFKKIELFDLGFIVNDLCPNEKPKLKKFFQKKISNYHLNRDFPAAGATSRLSVHLRFGTISVREVVRQALMQEGRGSEIWLSEIIWREFYVMILGNFPHVVSSAFKPQYDKIIWPNNKEWFERWCLGETGFPIIDAGMRELNTTGFMHNRVRMITASFLCKILLVDWRLGEAYFARKLLDFDLSANNGGWQWCASSGCDASPYFRIFNPYTQTEKFDPEGEYLRMFAPVLGASPMVNYPEQRARCLMLYKKYL